MAMNKDLVFRFNHLEQPDELFGNMTSAEIKQAFDSRGEQLKEYIYNIVDKLQSSGASDIGATHGSVVTTVQNAIDTITNKSTHHVKFKTLNDIPSIDDSEYGYESEVISIT